MMQPDPTQVPLQSWQVEEPQAIPPHTGQLRWFASQVPGMVMGPDGRPEAVTLTRLRIDHGHGRFYGLFGPDDLDKFGDWLKEQARLARSNIVTATELPPSNGGPPR